MMSVLYAENENRVGTENLDTPKFIKAGSSVEYRKHQGHLEGEVLISMQQLPHL